MYGAGRLDAELAAVSRRVSGVLLNLPRDITPVNLEELRRVKQCLVELESKADNLRCGAIGMCNPQPAASCCITAGYRHPSASCPDFWGSMRLPTHSA